MTSLDGRVEKKFTFGIAKLALDFDVFNVLNCRDGAGQAVRHAPDRTDRLRQTLEIMNPRIARLGARFSF